MTRLSIQLILADIRSAQNVGAILRTADACGIEHVYACGYTPYPAIDRDDRPPHVADANTRAIAKTALGAQSTMPITHTSDTRSAVLAARAAGYKVIVLEQSETSLNLYQYAPISNMALLLGNEVTGVSAEIMDLADTVLELPMIGQKESLNVAVAAGIAMYQLRFG
jgi:23S rRNA (guanosine2251-2'-O)-methyltransferase